MSEAQASCIVRQMNIQIEIERLGAREEPGADEYDKFAGLYHACTGDKLPK